MLGIITNHKVKKERYSFTPSQLLKVDKTIRKINKENFLTVFLKFSIYFVLVLLYLR